MPDIDRLESLDIKIAVLRDILTKMYHYHGEIIHKSYNHAILFHQSEWYLDFMDFKDYVKTGKEELAKVIDTLNEEIAYLESALSECERERRFILQSLDVSDFDLIESLPENNRLV